MPKQDPYQGFQINDKAHPTGQTLGIPGFAPQIDLRNPFVMGSSKKEILEFLRSLPEDVEFISPNDKLEHEISNKKIPSECVKFSISPIAKDATVVGQLGRMAKEFIGFVSLEHVAALFHTIGEAVNGVAHIGGDLKELNTHDSQVEVNAYLSPAHGNVVTFPGKTAVKASELADAIEAAFEQEVHLELGRSNQNPSQNKPTLYATGRNSFPPLFTDEEVREAREASTKTDKQSRRLSTRPRWS